MKTVVVSGYWDPPHVGHLRLFQAAKKLGDILIVIINNDEQQRMKGSIPFMPLIDRIELLHGLKAVDIVMESVDNDTTVCRTLEAIRPDVFANGGDRNEENVPEDAICAKLGIKMLYGVGGGKIRSSSELIKNVREKTVGMDWGTCRTRNIWRPKCTGSKSTRNGARLSKSGDGKGGK